MTEADSRCATRPLLQHRSDKTSIAAPSEIRRLVGSPRQSLEGG